MKSKNRKKVFYFFRFILITSIFVTSLSLMNHRFLPALQEISHLQCKNYANRIIDISAARVLSETNLQETPILLPHANGEGYFANTAMINHFCSQFSKSITEQISTLPYEKIKIPFGSITGWSFFADKGPEIPFTLLPMGSAKVDYQTEFTSVGINQINYKIWLNIFIEIKIVNPLYQENIRMERKIMLADIVFSGKVPDHYFQISPTDEYLLTE